MAERKTTYKHTAKSEKNFFLKKTLIQSTASIVIFIIMMLSIKIGGKNSFFNTQVRRYLNESTDVTKATRDVCNAARKVINDEIIPVFNNFSINND